MGGWTLWGWVQGSVTYKPVWNSMLATQMLAGQLHLSSSQDWLGQHTTQTTLTWTALSFCTTSLLEQYAGYTDVVRQLRLCSTQAWLWQHTTQMTWTALSLHHKLPGTACWLCRCWPDSCSLTQTWLWQHITQMMWTALSLHHKPPGTICWLCRCWPDSCSFLNKPDFDSILRRWWGQPCLSAQQATWNSMLATQMIARQLHLCPSQAGLGQHTTQMTWTASSCSVTSQTGTAC